MLFAIVSPLGTGDIDSFDTSRLRGETAKRRNGETARGVDDVRFHPLEKRSLRVGLVRRF